MKRMKKYFALAVALIMALALAAPAWAGSDTTPTTGTITINNATIGKDYTIYRLFEANPSGTAGTVAYTASESVKTWLEDAAPTLFTFTASTVEGTYNVTKVGSDEAVISFLNGLITKEGETTTVDTHLAGLKEGDTKTATEATVEFDGIPFGYYLVQSSLGAAVSVDTTNYNVTMVDKNQSGPSWNDPDNPDDPNGGKKIVTGSTTSDTGVTTTTTADTNSATYGQTVDFQLTLHTTNFNGDKKIITYYLKDEIDSGLTYNKDSLRVKVGANTLEPTAYSVTWTDPVAAAEGTDSTEAVAEVKAGFEITIPWATKNSETPAKYDFTYASPNVITVTYTATVNTDAVIAGEGNKNVANMTYQTVDSMPDTEPDPDPDPDSKQPYSDTTKEETTTYVFAIGLKKVDGATGDPLPGATFTVKKGDTVIKTDALADGTYSYNSAGTNETFVSGADGLVVIKGLDAGDYVLTETVAPQGYNLLSGTKTIAATVESVSTYSTTTTTYYDASGNVVNTETTGGRTVSATYPVNVSAITVENNSGTELPSTGGMGTTIFYTAGSILVVAAVVFFVTKKRVRA